MRSSSQAQKSKRSPPATDPHLPSAVTAFVGRDADRAALVDVVAKNRLVTLCGPPGMGKTRLGLEVAALAAGGTAHPDGARWVDLAAVTDPAGVVPAMAQALGVREQGGRALFDSMVASLRRRRLVMVIDNCEHLVEASSAVVQGLLRAGDGVTILTTSRRPLGLVGEHCHEISPLTVLSIGADPADVELTEAGALFCARARALHPRFRLDDDTAAAVARICRALDGIPLAIELAAGRLGTLSASEIAGRLDDRLGLLEGHQHGAWGRHQTLEEALDWSFDQLRPLEQVLLRRLGYFPREASFEAVVAVCAGGDLAAEAVLDLLAGLVSSALVAADTRGAEARYRLPTAVQQFARDRLAASADSAAVEARHAHCYTRWAERVEPFLSSAEQSGFRRSVENEAANMATALDSWWRAGDVGPALWLASSLTPWWADRGSPGEGRRWFDLLLPEAGDVDPNLRSKALWCSALLALHLGDTAAARPMIQEALVAATTMDLDVARARVLYLLGSCTLQEKDDQQAAAALEESVELARRIGDRWAEAHGLVLLAAVAEERGQTAEATALLERCVRVCMQGGDLESLTLALDALGRLARISADYWSADLHTHKALQAARQAGRALPTARALFQLGVIAFDGGEYDVADERLREAMDLALGLGDTECAADAMVHLGRMAMRKAPLLAAPAHKPTRRRAPAHTQTGSVVAVDRGRPPPEAEAEAAAAATGRVPGGARSEEAVAEARSWFTDAVAEAAASGSAGSDGSASVSAARAGLALLAALDDRPGDARELAHETLRLARQSGRSVTVARALLVVGVLARHSKDLPAARTSLGDALAAARASGDFLATVDCMDAVAGVVAAAGRFSHAARVFGATSSLRADHRLARFAPDCPFYEPDVALLRERLFADDFDAAWFEGAELTIHAAAELAAQGLTAGGDTATGWEKLTKAERAVVALVSEGLTNRRMGERLGISSHTVQSHLAHVFAKLGIHSRTVLVREAASRQQLLGRAAHRGRAGDLTA